VATEVTLVLRFEDGDYIPSDEDLEYELNCVVVERQEEDV